MRLALITGESGGLGKATARRFAEDGMTVIVTERKDPMLVETNRAALRNVGWLGSV